MEGQTVVGGTAWFYTSTAGKTEAEVRSEGQSLGSSVVSSTGWHSFPVSFNDSQLQLDAATMKLKVGGGSGPWEIYAAFVKLQLTSAPPSTIIRLRPDTDIARTGNWTVVGASKTWEALSDPVTEAETPSSGTRITGSFWGGVAEVGLGTLSLAGRTVLQATAWFYASNGSVVEAQVRSGSQVLGSVSVGGAGWHSFPVFLDGSQSQLDSAAMRFVPGSGGGTREVYSAFLKLTLKPPAEHIYWGAWIDGEPYGDVVHDAPWDESIWNSFVSHTNEKDVSIVHFGQPPPWNHPFDPVPIELARKRNTIPLMDMGSELDKEAGGDVALADIAGGSPEVISKLREWAIDVKNNGLPFFFRWDWEMNGNWFQWGEEALEDPATYAAAWRRFHDIAEEAGATNIIWVWCPNITTTAVPSPKSFYPGDGYVDWTCLDGYNWGGSEWTSFYDLFRQSYRELREVAPRKPIMIGETASQEIEGSKASWITDALTNQIPNNFPEVRAFLWFNWNHNGREWPIETSASAQEAFAAGIGSSYYATNTFGSLPSLEKIEPLP